MASLWFAELWGLLFHCRFWGSLCTWNTFYMVVYIWGLTSQPFSGILSFLLCRWELDPCICVQPQPCPTLLLLWNFCHIFFASQKAYLWLAVLAGDDLSLARRRPPGFLFDTVEKKSVRCTIGKEWHDKENSTYTPLECKQVINSLNSRTWWTISLKNSLKIGYSCYFGDTA